jgi:hypothetical protein
MNIGTLILLCALGALSLWYIVRWYLLQRARAQTQASQSSLPGLTDYAIGFVTNFFDTLGIGAFAPTSLKFSLQGQPPEVVARVMQNRRIASKPQVEVSQPPPKAR